MTIEEQLQQEQDKLNAKKAFYAKNKSTLDAIARGAANIEADVELDTCCVWFRATGDKHKLAEAIRILRTNGLKKSSGDEPQKGKSSLYQVYSNDDIPDITLSFSSTSCRRVQVGTKTETVETPIYETVCDELVLDAQS